MDFKRKRFSLQVIFIMVCAGLLAVYAGRMMGLHDNHLKGPEQDVSSSAKFQADNVPDSIVNDIAKHVGKVAGLEELVVLPSSSQTGYSVNAQIDLGPVIVDSKGVAEKIQQEVGEYFTEVFSTNDKIKDAQVYFMAGGQIVASAGLGMNVYRKLALETETGFNNLVTSIEQNPVVNGAGEDNSWFEIGEMN